MSRLDKQARELAERVGTASAVLARTAEVPDEAIAAIDEVRDVVAAMTPTEQDHVDPRLLDALQSGLLRAWQATDEGTPVERRRDLRRATEQVRQALWEIAEYQPVAADVPAKDVARWLTATLPVPRDDLASLLGVTARTLSRWAASDSSEPSGRDEMRLRLLARVVSYLRHTLTGPGVVAWMQRPHPQLGGRTPTELLDDPVEAPHVLSVAASARSHVVG